jgi:pyruvate kinase
MTTKPQLGKNVYKEELAKGREATESLRRALDQLIEEPGPQTRALLIAKAAIALSKIEAMLNQLDEIGRNTKNGT